MSWETCCLKGLIKEVSVDFERIESLKHTAENKIISSSMLAPNNITISSIIGLLYDAARELLESVALQNGYKLYNHECYVSFLRKIIGDEKMSDYFNAARLARNGVNYYGEQVSLEKGRLIIKDLNELIAFLRDLLRQEHS